MWYLSRDSGLFGRYGRRAAACSGLRSRALLPARHGFPDSMAVPGGNILQQDEPHVIHTVHGMPTWVLLFGRQLGTHRDMSSRSLVSTRLVQCSLSILPSLASLMSLTASLVTISRMQQCFNVMCISCIYKVFSVPVSLLYSVGIKIYYYYFSERTHNRHPIAHPSGVSYGMPFVSLKFYQCSAFGVTKLGQSVMCRIVDHFMILRWCR